MVTGRDRVILGLHLSRGTNKPPRLELSKFHFILEEIPFLFLKTSPFIYHFVIFQPFVYILAPKQHDALSPDNKTCTLSHPRQIYSKDSQLQTRACFVTIVDYIYKSHLSPEIVQKPKCLLLFIKLIFFLYQQLVQPYHAPNLSQI